MDVPLEEGRFDDEVEGALNTLILMRGDTSAGSAWPSYMYLRMGDPYLNETVPQTALSIQTFLTCCDWATADERKTRFLFEGVQALLESRRMYDGGRLCAWGYVIGESKAGIRPALAPTAQSIVSLVRFLDVTRSWVHDDAVLEERKHVSAAEFLEATRLQDLNKTLKQLRDDASNAVIGAYRFILRRLQQKDGGILKFRSSSVQPPADAAHTALAVSALCACLKSKDLADHWGTQHDGTWKAEQEALANAILLAVRFIVEQGLSAVSDSDSDVFMDAFHYGRNGRRKPYAGNRSNDGEQYELCCEALVADALIDVVRALKDINGNASTGFSFTRKDLIEHAGQALRLVERRILERGDYLLIKGRLRLPYAATRQEGELYPLYWIFSYRKALVGYLEEAGKLKDVAKKTVH